MKFELLTKNPMFYYRQACKLTEGIELSEENWKPKNEINFWVKHIIANHSTLRCVRFRIIDIQPKSVIMQIIRATKGHPQPEVQSSRPDWNNGKERSSDPYEEKLFMQDHTAESFVEMAKQRLCNRTEERTRKFMQNLVNEMSKSSEPFFVALSLCCKPYCEWYGGKCPELKSCGKYPKLSEDLFRP